MHRGPSSPACDLFRYFLSIAGHRKTLAGPAVRRREPACHKCRVRSMKRPSRPRLRFVRRFLSGRSRSCGARRAPARRPSSEPSLQAIEKTHAQDATFLLLAPTGKAADRIREKTGKPASTIHSFLYKRQWLNPNLTVRPGGGQKEDKVTTYVIDEASMLNLELLAALFRAINWSVVQRLIIVGDPNQLPPIGRGTVFADIIDWLRAHYPASLGELTVNLRQMENQVTGRGTGIIDLASLYVRSKSKDQKDEEESLRAEEMFQRLQDLPADGSVDKDLRVLFWKDSTDLFDKLVARMVADMELDTGQKLDPAWAPQALAERVESKRWRAFVPTTTR